MIYLCVDYYLKYQDVIGYLIGRSIEEKLSYSFIEESISYSKAFSQFEKSNVTEIAFSSMQKLYFDIFPLYTSKEFEYNPYDIYAWLGYAYLHLFLELQITFETLFIIFPIEDALFRYKIYHEMDISQLINYVKGKVKYSYLDSIMSYRNISSNELSNKTGISFSTIQALRYNKRQIDKLESGKVLALSSALNVKIESLLPKLNLVFDNFE